jgi:hypothetical protein
VVVVVVVGVLAPPLVLLDAANATAATATAADTMPAVRPPAAAFVADMAPLAGASAWALPAMNPNMIMTASAFFIASPVGKYVFQEKSNGSA